MSAFELSISLVYLSIHAPEAWYLKIEPDNMLKYLLLGDQH